MLFAPVYSRYINIKHSLICSPFFLLRFTVHIIHDFLWLMNNQLWTLFSILPQSELYFALPQVPIVIHLCDYVEIAVSDQDSNLDQVILANIETCHLDTCQTQCISCA